MIIRGLIHQVERFLRDVNNWRKERRRLKKDMQRMQRRWELKNAQKSSADKSSIPPIQEGEESAPFAVGFEPKITVIPPTPNATTKDGAVGNNHANSAPKATSNGNAATISTDDRDGNVTGNDHRTSSFNHADAPSLLTPTCDAGFPGEGKKKLLEENAIVKPTDQRIEKRT